MSEWISVEDGIPEIEDNSVIIHFGNGAVEMVHIEDMFGDVTCGLDENGVQLYTKRYLHNDPEILHWMPLPKPPVE